MELLKLAKSHQMLNNIRLYLDCCRNKMWPLSTRKYRNGLQHYISNGFYSFFSTSYFAQVILHMLRNMNLVLKWQHCAECYRGRSCRSRSENIKQTCMYTHTERESAKGNSAVWMDRLKNYTDDQYWSICNDIWILRADYPDQQCRSFAFVGLFWSLWFFIKLQG